jgi:hypothetical protein
MLVEPDMMRMLLMLLVVWWVMVMLMTAGVDKKIEWKAQC